MQLWFAISQLHAPQLGTIAAKSIDKVDFTNNREKLAFAPSQGDKKLWLFQPIEAAAAATHECWCIHGFGWYKLTEIITQSEWGDVSPRSRPFGSFEMTFRRCHRSRYSRAARRHKKVPLSLASLGFLCLSLASRLAQRRMENWKELLDEGRAKRCKCLADFNYFFMPFRGSRAA
jgi:hypothetical protein